MRAVHLLVVFAVAGCLAADVEPRLVVGVTTSVHDPGFDEHLLRRFRAETGERAVAVVGGSGEILERARRGDVDLAIVHHPEAETLFVAAGAGRNRSAVFENRFLLVGPPERFDALAGAATAAEAFARIAEGGLPFVSRGDGSGTHAREHDVWNAANVSAARLVGAWRSETGSGQATTLLVAAERRAFALADEATWTALDARGRIRGLAVVPLDDPALANVYSIVISTRAGAEAEVADRFAAWLSGPSGRDAVRTFEIEGRAVFRPAEAAP